MANRFTDSRKWDDDWFIELIPDHKLLWLYILDKCNHAGIYKHSKRLEECCLGCSPDWESALKAFNGKVKRLRDGKYFIPKFVEFQYGTLNTENRCHKSVLDILEKEGAYKGLKSTLEGCKEQEQDKELVKDKDNIGHFEKLWSKYPEKIGKKKALSSYKSSVKTDSNREDIETALKNYINSERVKKGFVQNGATWFGNWADWVEYKGTEKPKPTRPSYDQPYKQAW